MGISINPASVVFKWLDDRRDAQVRKADYLDSIAEVAAELATIWQDVVAKVAFAKTVDVRECKGANSMLVHPPNTTLCNTGTISRLEAFYNRVSDILGKENQSDVDPIVFHIASIIQKRYLTKALVEAELLGIEMAGFYSSDNTLDAVQTLEGSVLALHREAAALDIFAKSFRAKIV